VAELQEILGHGPEHYFHAPVATQQAELVEDRRIGKSNLYRVRLRPRGAAPWTRSSIRQKTKSRKRALTALQ